jgi:small subunit ribosomal protein S8
MRTDPIADLLTRIRNAQRTGHKAVRVIKSRLGGSVLEVLKTEGFIEDFEAKKSDESVAEEYEVFLKYYSSGQPALSLLKRMSKPGRRAYSGTDALPTIEGGLGISIISTSQGVMSDREARKRKIGGEILAVVG